MPNASERPPPSTTPRRIFLGLAEPPIVSAADALASMADAPIGAIDRTDEAETDGRSLDLQRTLVVTAGSRAGRVLLGRLVDHAATVRRPLSPPMIIAPAELVDLVLAPMVADETVRRPASAVECRLAWFASLDAAEQALVSAIAAAATGGAAFGVESDRSERRRLASMLQRTVTELASGLLEASDIPGLIEEEAAREPRWAAVGELIRRYEARLAAMDLYDRSMRYARGIRGGLSGDGVGVVKRDALSSFDRVVLIGVLTASPLVRGVLSLLADGLNVLVAADPADADMFDEFGCVRTDPWTVRDLSIQDRHIISVDGPDEQIDAAIATLARMVGTLTAGDIVVSTMDAATAASLAQHAADAGARRTPLRWSGGVPFGTTMPARLIGAAAEYVETRSTVALRSLLRHADFYDALIRPGGDDRLAGLDLSVIDDRLAVAPSRTSAPESAAGPLRGVSVLLGELAETDRTGAPVRRPPHRWAAAIRGFLCGVYSGRLLDPRVEEESLVVRACEHLAAALVQLELARPVSLPQRDMGDSPFEPVTAAEAMRLVLESTIEVAPGVPRPADADALEALGWLELYLDPSPAVVVVGMNEGAVPSPIAYHPLLPEALRREIGLDHDALRAARDACIAESLVRTRREVAFIAARRTRDGDPLRPSRLLARVSRDAVLSRVRVLLGRSGDEAAAAGGAGVASAADPAPSRPRHNAFRPFPRVDPLPTVERISVTAFRTYLRSPYEFYLRHVLGLDDSRPELTDLLDGEPEMNALLFGHLVHEAMERFARSGERDSSDADAVRRAMASCLDDAVLQRFGGEPGPLVVTQIDAAMVRIGAFAAAQAARAAAGWRILHAEWSPPGGSVSFDVDGVPVLLRGKIDRIDFHAASGRYALIDYKTAETAATPEKQHRVKDRWTDLQLPLYRRLLGAIVPPGDLTAQSVELLYANLSAEPGSCRFERAEWDEADFSDADNAACDVVRCIRRGEFFVAGPEPPADGAAAALMGRSLLGAAASVVGGDDDPFGVVAEPAGGDAS